MESAENFLNLFAFASQKVAIPVDDGNFLAWKQHVLLVIMTHWLQSFVDRTIVIPPASLHNQLVKSSGSSFALWEALMRLFGSHSTTKAIQSVSLEEQQSAILNGLPPEFDHVVSIITTSKVPFNLQGVTMVLLDAKARQQGHLS
ncbi:hypothetical protein CXB51_031481 [Gossypium anomalum]|uniref:Retrotransposon Copia-like N-terminal domain-containing protein n=1 Tax=Gossypium anomalum TaxID=47600 RepID=A0A8J5YQE6_9ROSI|nr:hypothetical protein CXB51_031481 [Gossypium anomalum]